MLPEVHIPAARRICRSSLTPIPKLRVQFRRHAGAFFGQLTSATLKHSEAAPATGVCRRVNPESTNFRLRTQTGFDRGA